MKKIVWINLCVCLLFTLCSCGRQIPKDRNSTSQITDKEVKELKDGKYLFNAKEMDSVEISGEDLLNNKEVNISTAEEDGRDIDLRIKREKYGPSFGMDVFFEEKGIDLVTYLEKSMDEWGGALEDFYYQLACYDFDNDGEKEIIVGGGNKKDILELYILRLDYDNPGFDNAKILKSINGGCKAYVNEKKEICVVDAKGQSNTISYTLSDDGVLDVMGEGEVPAGIFPFTTDEVHEEDYDIQKIVVHEGITGLGEKCFANFYSAEAVILPEGLKKIGAHAFDGCVSLKQIRLPDTVEEIGAYAFEECLSLQELTLPPSLERYPVNAMKQCSALKKVKNCSSRTWKLCSGKSLHGTWYGGGSKVDSIKPGQTVKLISDEYKITYDLNGGIAKGKLPETYSYGDGIKLPDTVERKGYQLVGWDRDDYYEPTWYIEPQTKGNRRVRAVWLDFHVEDLGKGKIRAFWNISDDYYNCQVRYSQNEDMSDYKFVNKFYVQSVTISKLEKGKRYYIEYAVIDDMDDFETLDDLPWSGKMSIVVR